MTLSREMTRVLNRWLRPRLALALVMVLVAQLVIYNGQVETNRRQEALAEQQLQISRAIEKDTIRGELSDIDHRIKQERCVIEPINQVVRQRIEDRTDSPRFRLCDPDEALPDLMARRDRLDARLREMGAYEVRDE